MPIYTVHAAPAQADPIERACRTAFVREGFNRWAFLFGPLFLLRHRAWAAAAVWLVLVLACGWLARWAGLPPAPVAALVILLQLFLGLEGNDLRRAALARRGYALADVVGGAEREEAERVFFRSDAAAVPPAELALPGPTASRFRDADAGAIIGLFPSPEG